MKNEKKVERVGTLLHEESMTQPTFSNEWRMGVENGEWDLPTSQHVVIRDILFTRSAGRASQSSIAKPVCNQAGPKWNGEALTWKLRSRNLLHNHSSRLEENLNETSQSSKNGASAVQGEHATSSFSENWEWGGGCVTTPRTKKLCDYPFTWLQALSFRDHIK